MARNGTFYLGRVTKTGRLDNKLLRAALHSPQPIYLRDFGWTFTDIAESPDEKWIYGRLSKFIPEGEVGVVDLSVNREIVRAEPDLIVASSPFVYIPAESTIAFLHVWNQIQKETFSQRFCDLITRHHDNFFVGCEIEPISDLRSFLTKVAALQKISNVVAQVRPPNPLFGPLWADLNKYIKQRNADTIKIDERSVAGGLATDLPAIARASADGREFAQMDRALGIGDAALLMAVDGYGSGRIRGQDGDKDITIRTADTQVSFSAARDVAPEVLARLTEDLVLDHSKDRGHRHGDIETEGA